MQQPLLRNVRMGSWCLLRNGSRGRRGREVCRVECVWRARRCWADRHEDWAVGRQWRLQSKVACINVRYSLSSLWRRGGTGAASATGSCDRKYAQ